MLITTSFCPGERGFFTHTAFPEEERSRPGYKKSSIGREGERPPRGEAEEQMGSKPWFSGNLGSALRLTISS